jgi:CTP synthase
MNIDAEPIEAKNGTGLKILIVEDTQQTFERLQLTINRLLDSPEIQHQSDFAEAMKVLESPRPFEAIVLDLYLGVPEEGNKEGQKIWEQIWKNKFLPVIIYTAGDCAELDPPVPSDNPFVTCINKGVDSDEKVAEYLKKLMPYMVDLRDVEEDLTKAIRIVLSKTAPVIWNSTEKDTSKRSELLVRGARRRLAAAMDMQTETTDQTMFGWEQYIYPPLEESLLTGDIIRSADDPVEEPASYRLVLSPSCDLQMNKGKCKVTEVLVAKCAPIDRYTGAILSQYKFKKEKLPEFLSRLLSEPHQGGFIPLPSYWGILPSMAASLRELELIPVDEIDAGESTGRKYRRTASVDSPFREFITWAYLQIIGRPGMPERDLDSWAKEVIAGKVATAAESAGHEVPGFSPKGQEPTAAVEEVNVLGIEPTEKLEKSEVENSKPTPESADTPDK